MAEDVSAQARTGVTIIVLAALIAVVLNLVVIAQNIVSNGLGTLQNAVSSIQDQEYEVYNQKKVTGVEVRTAISLFTARDNGIIVCTKAAQRVEGFATDGTNPSQPAFNYGALLQKPNAAVGTDGTPTNVKEAPLKLDSTKTKGENGYAMDVTAFGWVPSLGTDTSSVDKNNYTNTGEGELRLSGNNYYTMEYQKNAAGIINQYNDIQAINDVNSLQYIQESGVFRAELIKNASGKTIGIIFFQIS